LAEQEIKIQMMIMTNRSFVVIWMKLKFLCPRIMVVTMS
jgi:hypothetical protein